MDKGDKSEHSRKNESTDEEKPLKKARYLWEVKGKSHLKNSSDGPLCAGASSSQEIPGCSNSGESKKHGNEVFG